MSEDVPYSPSCNRLGFSSAHLPWRNLLGCQFYSFCQWLKNICFTERLSCCKALIDAGFIYFKRLAFSSPLFVPCFLFHFDLSFIWFTLSWSILFCTVKTYILEGEGVTFKFADILCATRSSCLCFEEWGVIMPAWKRENQTLCLFCGEH